MRTVTSFGKAVLLFVDGIPKCGTKIVVDNVSDLVIGVEVFRIKVQEASTNTIEFPISSLLGNQVSNSLRLEESVPSIGVSPMMLGPFPAGLGVA